MHARHQQYIELLKCELAPLLKNVLAKAVATHYPETYWDEIVTVFLRDAELVLSKSPALDRLSTAGDLVDARGSANLEGILKTLEVLRDRKEGTQMGAQIAYLVHHVQNTFDAL